MTGLLGVAAAVATVGAAILLPWPGHTVAPSAELVTPTASEQQRVCPGPLLALAADASAASSASSIGAADTLYAAGRPGSLEASALAVSPLAVPDNVTGDAAGTPLLLSVPASESSPLLGGAQSQTAGTETLSGFAAAGCAEAASDGWLVAGSTAIGQTSLLLLSNPSDVAASVDLTLYGEGGLVDAPGSTGILVQPQSQRVIPLAGLAPNLNSPVVHVTTRGGQVVASLQQSVIEGLNPGGIELAGTTAPPALEQLIAGFIVPAHVIDETQSNDSHFHDDDAAVRVLNTGPDAAELTVSATSDDGGNGTSITVTLEPGVASEVPLTELAAGSYTVRLNADQPIVAAARSTEKSATSEDFAWFVSSQALVDDSVIVVADGQAPTLRLANPHGNVQRVTLQQDGSGTPQTVNLPAAGAVSVPLTAGAVYTLGASETGGVVASVSYQGGAALSSFALNPPGPLARAIAVYTH
jgi:hypothetical protein